MSRQTPTRRWSFILAMIDASCSNVAPSAVPWPAVCSSRTIVLPRRRARSSSSSAVGDQRQAVGFAADV